MKKLTYQNYYTSANKYLSSSKLTDWFFDKYYFYQKHILNKITEEPTNAMKTGKAIDYYVFNGRIKFESHYLKVERRNLKNPPQGYEELLPDDYDNIMAMGEMICSQSCFRDLKDFKAQEILQYEEPIGYFKGLCGIPDWYKIEKEKGIIVDLKTISAMNRIPFYRAFFIQQAFYQILLSLLNPGISSWESRLFVLAKNEDRNFYFCEMFLIEQDCLEKIKVQIKEVIEDIKQERDWLPHDANWENSRDLSYIQYETL